MPASNLTGKVILTHLNDNFRHFDCLERFLPFAFPFLQKLAEITFKVFSFFQYNVMYFMQRSVSAPKETQNNCKSAQIPRSPLFFFFSRFSSFLSFHPSGSNVGVEFVGQTCYIGGSPSIGSIHQWAGLASGKIYISYQIQTPTNITSKSNFQMVTPAAGGKDDKTPSTC